MLDAETLDRIFEQRRLPMYDIAAPDGELHLECVGRLRDSSRLFYTSAERRGRHPLSVQYGHTVTPHGDLRVATVSYPNHMPSWGEMKRVRETLFPPRMDVMMVLPGSDTHYINDHPYALWMWQMPEKWGWPPMSTAEAVAAVGGRILNQGAT